MFRQDVPHTTAKQLLQRQLLRAVPADQYQVPIERRATQSQNTNRRRAFEP